MRHQPQPTAAHPAHRSPPPGPGAPRRAHRDVPGPASGAAGGSRRDRLSRADLDELECLHDLARAGDADGLRQRLAALSPPRARELANRPHGEHAWTLLHTLAAGRPPALAALEVALAAGAEVDAPADRRVRPLHLALGWSLAVCNHVVCPAWLGALAARLAWEIPAIKAPSLQAAMRTGEVDLRRTRARLAGDQAAELVGQHTLERAGAVRLLLAAGADPHAPIKWLSIPGRVELGDKLVEACWSVPGGDNLRPLQLATLLAQADCVGALSAAYRALVPRPPGPPAQPFLDALLLSKGAVAVARERACRMEASVPDAVLSTRFRLKRESWTTLGGRAATRVPLINRLAAHNDRQMLGQVLKTLAEAGPARAARWLNEAVDNQFTALGALIHYDCGARLVDKALHAGARADTPAMPDASNEATLPAFIAAGVTHGSFVAVFTVLDADFRRFLLRQSPPVPSGIAPVSEAELVAARRTQLAAELPVRAEIIRLLVDHGADPTRRCTYRSMAQAEVVGPDGGRRRLSQGSEVAVSLLDLAVLGRAHAAARVLMGFGRVRDDAALVARARELVCDDDEMAGVLASRGDSDTPPGPSADTRA